MCELRSNRSRRAFWRSHHIFYWSWSASSSKYCRGHQTVRVWSSTVDFGSEENKVRERLHRKKGQPIIESKCLSTKQTRTLWWNLSWNATVVANNERWERFSSAYSQTEWNSHVWGVGSLRNRFRRASVTKASNQWQVTCVQRSVQRKSMSPNKLHNSVRLENILISDVWPFNFPSKINTTKINTCERIDKNTNDLLVKWLSL